MGLAAIFLMGVHSAIFGPSKYGLLPELLPEKRLSWGNGILELGTFLAIILGMMAGAELFDCLRGAPGLVRARFWWAWPWSAWLSAWGSPACRRRTRRGGSARIS